MRPAFAIFIAFLLGMQEAMWAVLPLREQWTAACNALSEGKAGQAHALFGEFERWYGEEEIALEESFREKRLRLRALAALQAGQLAEASRLMQAWLTHHPREKAFRAWFLFNVSELESHLGDAASAETHRAAFLAENPGLPEAILIHWARADEAVRREDLTGALPHLERISEHPALPGSGKVLVTSAAASLHLALGDWKHAYGLLLSDAPGEGRELQAFWRALMAPSLVQALIESADAAESVIAASWFAEPEALRDQFARITNSLAQAGKARGIRQSLWNARWGSQIKQMRAYLGHVLETGCGTDRLYQLRLRSLLAGKQPRDATVLARALRMSARELPADLRIAAYHAEIEGHLALGETPLARKIGNAFIQEFPSDEGLPEIRFLLARTAAEEKAWESAIEQVRSLLLAYPGHSRKPKWALLHASWLLEAGNPREALDAYRELKGHVSKRWLPFLHFQIARCHEGLREYDRAATVFRTVVTSPEASPILRENAMTILLKRLLADGRLDEFDAGLRTYGDHFAEGRNRLLVENMSAEAQRRRGRTKEAVGIYRKVATANHPAATHARRQLSRIFRQEANFEGLGRHALDWIRSRLHAGAPCPEDPFRDLLAVQTETGRAILPERLLLNLMEEFQACRTIFPAGSLFALLRDRWAFYAGLLLAGDLVFEDWLTQQGNLYLRANCLPAWACFQACLASDFSRRGRHDSADTYRIRILRTLPPGMAGEEMLFTMAETASRYDFPEAKGLLEHFLLRFPGASATPQVLAKLASICRRTGQPAKAERLLREILHTWPESTVALSAGLQLAEWRLEAGDAPDSLRLADFLGENPLLDADQTARLLAMRVRADIAMGNAGRALLSAVRLFTLYPDFRDIISGTEAVMKAHLATLPESAEKTSMQTTLDKALSSDENAPHPI